MLTSHICGSSRILAADLSEKLATTQPSSQILLHNAMSMMVKRLPVILPCIRPYPAPTFRTEDDDKVKTTRV
jgi:hypothetical protein